MTLRPGSVPWLLRHEARLLWRRSNLAPRKLSAGLLAAGVAAGAQLLGFALAAWLRDGTAALADRLAAANAVLLVMGGLMLSQALDAALATLFERRDLDWLLASPVPLRRVLAARMTVIAASVAVPWLLLLGGVANAMAVAGQPGWLAAYPMVCALALLVAAAGAALAVGVVSVLGLRRARRAVGALGMLAGGVAFLASQSATMLPLSLRATLWRALSPPCCGTPDGLAWWPARALLGDVVPLMAVLLAWLAVAALAARALARRFAAGAILVPPRRGPGAARAARRGVDAGRFRRGTFGTLLRKELRLLRRTPNLLSRVAYQLIYAVPMTAALWRDGGATAALGLGAASVFVAGEAARLLISAAANADEAAELAATAPVPPGAVQRAKMAAAGLGTAAILLLPVLAVAAWRPGLLPALVGGVACVTGSGLLMGVWRPVPARRGDLGASRPRLGGNDWLGLLLSGLWAGAAWLAMDGNALAALPSAVAVAVLAGIRPRGRRIGLGRR
jgi:ABC-2 type transport system permease protein